MRKDILVMAAVALVAGYGGYFLAMVMDREVRPDAYLEEAATGPTAQDLVGRQRPDFTLQDTRGNTVSAGDFDGRVLLVNFWATWCTPCVEEMPMLAALQQELAGDGFQVVGIALDDADRARAFAADLGVDYPVLVGKTDVVLAGRRFGNATGMLPYSVLVDAKGTVRWTHLGILSRDELVSQIRQIH